MADKELEQVLGLLTYGVYIVTTAKDDQYAAILTPWLTQVSVKPAVVAFSAPRDSRVSQMLSSGSSFVVNVLRAGQKTLADDFLTNEEASGPLRGHEHDVTEGGVPFLKASLAMLECSYQATVDTGKDFVLVVGEATRASVLTAGQPLTLRQTGLQDIF